MSSPRLDDRVGFEVLVEFLGGEGGHRHDLVELRDEHAEEGRGDHEEEDAVDLGHPKESPFSERTPCRETLLAYLGETHNALSSVCKMPGVASLARVPICPPNSGLFVALIRAEYTGPYLP